MRSPRTPVSCEIARRDTPSSLFDTYARFCADNNLTPAVLR
jgi:hypothetical protein